MTAMVKRVLGLKRLPHVSTLSRSLASADAQSVGKVQIESRHLVMERLTVERFSTVTLDFRRVGVEYRAPCRRHGSGIQQEEKRRPQLLSPLLHRRPTTDQVLDVHHRPGNVHDSNGADTFIERCVRNVRARLPRAKTEVPYRQCIPSTRPSLSDFTPWGSNSPSRCLLSVLPASKSWSKADDDGGQWPLGSAISRPAGNRSRGTLVIASSSSEKRSDAKTNHPSNSTCSSPSSTATSSRSS